MRATGSRCSGPIIGLFVQEDRRSSDPFVHDLKAKIAENKAKLERLTDAMLDGSLDVQEFRDRKNVLMAEKADLQGKLAEFERTGSRWVELTRNWILTGNTAQNICAGENHASMRNFLRDVGSNPKIQNSLFTLALKIRLIIYTICEHKTAPVARRLWKILKCGGGEIRTPVQRVSERQSTGLFAV